MLNNMDPWLDRIGCGLISRISEDWVLRHMEDIENLVNEQIRQNTLVQSEEMGIQDALGRGALGVLW